MSERRNAYLRDNVKAEATVAITHVDLLLCPSLTHIPIKKTPQYKHK